MGDVGRLFERLRKFRDDRQWSQFHTPKDLAVSVSIEAAELLEIFQWRPADATIDPAAVDAIQEEVADIILYLALLCDLIGVDPIAAAHSKIDRNEKRFPVNSSRGVAKPKEDPLP